MGWERKGFLGSDTWRMSSSRSLPDKDGFQTEEIKGLAGKMGGTFQNVNKY